MLDDFNYLTDEAKAEVEKLRQWAKVGLKTFFIDFSIGFASGVLSTLLIEHWIR